MARSLDQALRVLPPVSASKADARTGNVLLEHRPDLSAQEVLGLVAEARSHLEQGAAEAHDPATEAAERHPVLRDVNGGWHTSTAGAALERLDCDATRGLASGDVQARLRRAGRNELIPPKPRSELALLLEQFLSLPVALLGGSVGVSVATRSYLEAAVTAGVVLANAGIGYFTESGAQRIIGRLVRADILEATVLRDGREQRLAAKWLVPGDVVVVRRGDPVPADARLIESERLSVNESLLTGESVPQLKDAEAVLDLSTRLAERRNLVFMGTTVAGGSGRGVVVATGDDTAIGRIQRLAGAAVSPTTPIEGDLNRLSRDLALGALAVCGIAFGLGVLRGHPVLRILKSAIALAVAAVPEGLPAVTTSTLALGLRRMRRQQLLVRRLEAVEGLGSVQTLCLDKTGTLTENRMKVTAVSLEGTSFSLEEHTDGGPPAARLRHMAELAVLAGETPIGDEEGEFVTRLSGTERAVVDFAVRADVDLQALAADFRRTGSRLRDDRSNFVMVAYRSSEGPLLVVKGRPGEVLGLCRSIRQDGAVRALSEDLRQAIHRNNELLAAEGLRVLGLAYSRESDSLRPGEVPLVWCGHLAMSDPIRAGAREAIRRLQRAGMRTVMITGDQAPTAVKVAEALDLSAGEPLKILDTLDLEHMDPSMLSALAAKTHVFARVTPAEKLKIVQALQHAGQAVAMTGDGINDGPALKAADVGIAMGRDGARIARDVADVVIEDDDLNHLIQGVREGRTILSNIRKSVHFLLATNLSEIFVVFAEILGGPAEVESPMELLWINLVTDVFPSLGLALEPPAPDVMNQPPRPRNEPLVDNSYYKRLAAEAGIIGASTLAAHGYGLLRYGPGPVTRGVTFLAMVSAQLMHTLTCRTDRFHTMAAAPLGENRTLVGALGLSAALQVVPFVVPPMRRLLGIGPLGPLDMVVAGGACLTSFALNQWLLARDAELELAERGPPALSIEAAS